MIGNGGRQAKPSGIDHTANGPRGGYRVGHIHSGVDARDMLHDNLVLLMLALKWTHQFKATMTTAVEQACKLQSAFARPAQKLQVDRSKRPSGAPESAPAGTRRAGPAAAGSLHTA